MRISLCKWKTREKMKSSSEEEEESSCADKKKLLKENFFHFVFYHGGKVGWEADYEWHVFNKLFYWLVRFHPLRLSPAPFICGKIINKQRTERKEERESSWSSGLYDFIRTLLPWLPIRINFHPKMLASRFVSFAWDDEEKLCLVISIEWASIRLCLSPRSTLSWFMIARRRLLKLLLIISC